MRTLHHTLLSASSRARRALASLSWRVSFGVALALGLVALAPAASAQCTGWAQSEVVGPSIRSSHAMVFDSNRGRTVLFGGYGPKPDGSEYLSDTWEFDGSSWSLRTTGGPSARQNPAMAFDSARSRVVMFGGFAFNPGPVTYGQTWEWNGTAWSMVSSSGPSARYMHAMAYDAARQQTILFGGLADGVYRDTVTWAWNGSAWTQAASSGPTTRFGHAMAYDPIRQKMVLFGGFGGSGDVKTLLRDTWEWNGSGWTLITGAGPVARQYHAMAFDASRGKIVLVGGRGVDGATLQDVWEWNGATWSLLTDTAPSARESTALSFDASRQRLMLVGGFSERGRFGDVWERSSGTGSAPGFSQSPGNRKVVPGTAVLLSAVADGTGPMTYQWLRNGSALVDGGRYSGVWTTTLVISGAETSDSGVYTLRATNGCGSATTVPANVEVRCPADLDDGSMTGTPDGAVEVSDLIAFVVYFEAGDVAVDIDDGSGLGREDGGVDINDFLFFLVRFDQGC